MKYEPIFGDQSLFDGAPEDAVAVFKSPMRDSRCAYYRLSHGHERYIYTDWVGVPAVDSQTFNAMRRIIPEPKRWTVEDQKAGRLPEVGAKVDGGKVVFVNGFNVVTELKRGAVIVSSSKTFLNTFKPIESPEEKAQRLRSEWINKAYVDFHRPGCELEVLQKEQIKQIYDALLSGELPVPVKDGE